MTLRALPARSRTMIRHQGAPCVYSSCFLGKSQKSGAGLRLYCIGCPWMDTANFLGPEGRDYTDSLLLVEDQRRDPESVCFACTIHITLGTCINCRYW